MSAAALNLGAIHSAIVKHNGNCGFPIQAVLMNPFEVDRLGWEDFEGIPIRGDSSLPTGRFKLLCEGAHDKPAEETEAVGAPPPARAMPAGITALAPPTHQRRGVAQSGRALVASQPVVVGSNPTPAIEDRASCAARRCEKRAGRSSPVVERVHG